MDIYTMDCIFDRDFYYCLFNRLCLQVIIMIKNQKIAYASCLGVVGILTTEFGVIGILPQIATYYHITIDRAGLLLSVFALIVAIIGPFMSLLSSKYNRKVVMMASLSLFLITGIVSSFAPPFWLLLTVRLIPTLLHSAYFASAIAAVINVSGPKDQHKMMAIALSGINIATVTTIPLATYLAGIFSWQHSFMLQAVVSALALLSIVIVMPSMPANKVISYGSQLNILRKPAVLLSLAMCILMFAGEFAIYSYFADYMMQIKGFNTKSISYLMLLFGITGLAGTWIAGKVLGRSIPLTNIFFLAGCNIIVPLFLYFSGSAPFTTAVIVSFWGVLYAPGVLIATSSISSAAPEALEFANGLTASFANFGITLGTMAGGWMIVHKGVGRTPWLSAFFGLAAIMLIVVRSIWDRREQHQVTIG